MQESLTAKATAAAQAWDYKAWFTHAWCIKKNKSTIRFGIVLLSLGLVLSAWPMIISCNHNVILDNSQSWAVTLNVVNDTVLHSGAKGFLQCHLLIHFLFYLRLTT